MDAQVNTPPRGTNGSKFTGARQATIAFDWRNAPVPTVPVPVRSHSLATPSTGNWILSGEALRQATVVTVTTGSLWKFIKKSTLLVGSCLLKLKPKHMTFPPPEPKNNQEARRHHGPAFSPGGRSLSRNLVSQFCPTQDPLSR